MKITSFNPLIVTGDAEKTIKLYEELGFERRHSIDVTSPSKKEITSVRMKDANGFYVDIANVPGTEKDLTLIRMNVDDFEETVEFLLAHGFRKPRHERASKTVDTGSSTYTMLVSPSGYIMAVSQHIKNRD